MSSQSSPIHFTIYDEIFPKVASKSEKRKIQIIEKTIQQLATTGVESMSYESVAEACGATRALIRHYFPDWDELILLVMRFVRAKFQKLCIDAIQTQTQSRDQLKIYIETACSWSRHSPQDARVWLLFYYQCGINKKYRQLNSELVSQGHIRITALLKEIGPKKSRIAEQTYAARAKLIQNAITSYFVATLTEEHTVAFNQKMLATTLELCFKIVDAA